MSIYDDALKLHKELTGKIEVNYKGRFDTLEDLSLLYSPGVAQPCIEIAKDPELVYDYTAKGNMIAIVTDGTAVLGLGDLGAAASLPVMEGKAALFKRFAGVDAFPIALDTKDADKIIETVKLIAPMFGGINLEDIAAPKCFYIESELKKYLDIPVFHDDQHGTAVVVLAALKNALALVDKDVSEVKIVINGMGAAGTAVYKLLKQYGAKNFALCDKGDNLKEAVRNADVFIGVSAGGVLTSDMVRLMNTEAVVFALANPTPEILPELAYEAGATVVATGRSDYPNQINNALAFPGIFRGALDVRVSEINDEMKIAAAEALCGLIDSAELSRTNIIPSALDARVAKAVAKAVADAAVKSGVSKCRGDSHA